MAQRETKAPTFIWLFVLQAADKQWFIRFVRNGNIFNNTETYKSKSTADKIKNNWLKLSPLFKDGNANTRSVPPEIKDLPEWKATHPTPPWVGNIPATC